VTVTVLLQSASTIATLAGPALVGVVVDAVQTGRPTPRTRSTAPSPCALLAVVAAVLRYFGGVRAVVGEDSLAEMRTGVRPALSVPVDLVERPAPATG
jgi:hypothetical protein